jgi:hypothetical protein
LISSGTNSLMVFSLAGVSASDEFGIFMVAYFSFTMLLAATRNAFGVEVSLASSAPTRVRVETGSSTKLLIAGSPIIVALVIAAPALAGAEISAPLLVLSIATIAALIQDVLRYSLAALGDYGRLLAGDLLWLLFVVVGVILRFTVGIEPAAFIALWGLGAAVSYVFMFPHAAVPVSVPTAALHLRRTLANRVRLAVATLTRGASITLAGVLVVRLVGPEAHGALVGASQLMTPASFLVALFGLAVLPVAARSGVRAATSLFVKATLAVVVLCITWLALALLLPDFVGVLILGETWTNSIALLPIVGVTTTFVVAGVGGATLLMQMQRAESVMWLRIGQALLRVPSTAATGAVTRSTTYLALLELALATAFSAAVWLLAFRTMKLTPEPDSGAPG